MPRALTVIVAFLAAGMAVGALDGGLAARHAGGGGFAVLAGAALAGAVALVAGALAALALWTAGKWARVTELRERLAGLTDRSAADRTPVVRAHAWVIAAALCAAVALLALDQVLRRTWMLEEEGFARRFSTGVATALFIGALAGTPLLAALLHRPLARLDGRVRLPLPPQPELRWALWVTLPVAIGLIPFAVAERDLLGPQRAALLWGLCGVALAPVTGGLLGRVMRRSRRARRIAAGAAGGVWAAALAATLALWDGQPDGARAIERAGVAHAGGNLVRLLSDVDLDGASALLGGGDCAPFDGDRAPRNRDLPGNGVDEDCDGADLPEAAGALYPVVTRSGALAPELVKKWNFIWITLDAVRADHVGAYGYEKPTTPYLDAFAGEALLYEQAYTQSTRTFFSVASMFAGLDPSAMTWERTGRYQNPASRHSLLAERLGELGYRSELIVAGGMEEEFTGLQQGFAQVHDYFLDRKWKQWRQRAAPSTTTMAIRAIERLSGGSQPFFLAIHYIDPHSPYTAHPEGYPSFGKGAKADYDADIAFTDRHVGFLLEFLRHRPKLAAQTVVLIMADHGEEFGEHGGRFHGNNCHRESVQVPLMVRVPGLPAQRIARRVAMVDVAPTVLELVGAGEGGEAMHGQSLLVPALTPDAWDPQRPIFCMTASASGRLFLRRSVRVGDLALFHEVHNGKRRMYDTGSDPGEKRDVLATPPAGADVSALERLLAASLTGNVQEFW